MVDSVHEELREALQRKEEESQESNQSLVEAAAAGQELQKLQELQAENERLRMMLLTWSAGPSAVGAYEIYTPKISPGDMPNLSGTSSLSTSAYLAPPAQNEVGRWSYSMATSSSLASRHSAMRASIVTENQENRVLHTSSGFSGSVGHMASITEHGEFAPEDVFGGSPDVDRENQELLAEVEDLRSQVAMLQRIAPERGGDAAAGGHADVSSLITALQEDLVHARRQASEAAQQAYSPQRALRNSSVRLAQEAAPGVEEAEGFLAGLPSFLFNYLCCQKQRSPRSDELKAFALGEQEAEITQQNTNSARTDFTFAGAGSSAGSRSAARSGRRTSTEVRMALEESYPCDGEEDL